MCVFRLALLYLGMDGDDVISKYSGIGFLADYNRYFEDRAANMTKPGDIGVEAVHE